MKRTKVILEGARHFERLAEDLKDKEVDVVLKKVEDADAFYRAVCILLGREPKKRFSEDS